MSATDVIGPVACGACGDCVRGDAPHRDVAADAAALCLHGRYLGVGPGVDAGRLVGVPDGRPDQQRCRRVAPSIESSRKTRWAY